MLDHLRDDEYFELKDKKILVAHEGDLRLEDENNNQLKCIQSVDTVTELKNALFEMGISDWTLIKNIALWYFKEDGCKSLIPIFNELSGKQKMLDYDLDNAVELAKIMVTEFLETEINFDMDSEATLQVCNNYLIKINKLKGTLNAAELAEIERISGYTFVNITTEFGDPTYVFRNDN